MPIRSDILRYSRPCKSNNTAPFLYTTNSAYTSILLPLRPLLHRSPTKLPLHPRHLIQPNNLPNLKILLMIPKEPLPMLHLLPNLPPSHPNILLAPNLPLPTTQRLNLLLIVNGDKHLLGAGEVVREVFLETARDEGARGVAAGEEVVVARGTVHHAVGGDVEDGAVDGEVDGEGAVGAIVEGELGGG